MINKIDSAKMGVSTINWLDTKFHFSFANYYNPSNIDFGVLRVLNDDIIAPHSGFDFHPHNDMEIITYVVSGKLTHKDSIENENTLSRGNVQYMSAGYGIEHSEKNEGDDPLRLLQIWIYPDKKNHEPSYGDYIFDENDRKNKLLKIVTSKNGNGPIKINQDVNIYALELEKERLIDFNIEKNRQAYIVQIEGTAKYNQIVLNERDGLEAIAENLTIEASENSHILIIEMKK